jgi:HK97 gp10 family phage protein
MVTFKVSGFAELERALRALPKEAFQVNAVRSAMKRAAQPTAELASATAPVDWGDLEASVAVRSTPKRDRQFDVQIGIGAAKRGKEAAFWGLFQEFGTAHHPAQPWLRPAWDATKDQVRDALGDELWKAIERTAKRLARVARKAGR